MSDSKVFRVWADGRREEHTCPLGTMGTDYAGLVWIMQPSHTPACCQHPEMPPPATWLTDGFEGNPKARGRYKIAGPAKGAGGDSHACLSVRVTVWTGGGE